MTHAKSNKVLEILENKHVSISIDRKNIVGSGIAESLGWVLNPQNQKIRSKLREVFARWYDDANDESDENFIFLVIRIHELVITKGHGATTQKIHLDFVAKRVKDEVKPMSKRKAFKCEFRGENALQEGRSYIEDFYKNYVSVLDKNHAPVYVLGSYNIMQPKDSDFMFTFYVIGPKEIEKAELEAIDFLGGEYARRFTNLHSSEESAQDLHQTFLKDKDFTVNDAIIIEQYMIDKPKIGMKTKILQLLPLTRV